MKAKKLLFIIPCCLIFCAQSCTKKEDAYHIDLYADGCTVSGIESSYQTNDVAKLKVNVNSQLYYLPTYDNLKVYGVDNYEYNDHTGDLTFRVVGNVAVYAQGEGIYGLHVPYKQFLYKYANIARRIETTEIPWISAQFIWDFSDITDDTTKTNLLDKLKTLGLETDQLKGNKFVSQSETPIEERKKNYIWDLEDFAKAIPDDSNNDYFDASTEKLSLFAYETKYSLFANMPTLPVFLDIKEISGEPIKPTINSIDCFFTDYDIGTDELVNGSLAIAYNYEVI